MKFAVGVMLCSFGVFWVGEGAGLSWPGGDAILLALIAALLAAALAGGRRAARCAGAPERAPARRSGRTAPYA